MSQWVDLPLTAGDGTLQPSFSSLATLINLMFVRNPPGAPRPYSLHSTPCIGSAVSSAGTGAMRGMISHGDYIWWVKGTTLRRYDGSTVTSVGTVNGTAPVHMVGAGVNQIFIVDGAGNEYVADTASVTSVAPPAGNFSDCTYQDGYTIAIREGTDEFYISDLDDPTTFGALNFSTADAISDELVACYVHNRELHLFGKKHLEIWNNTGASPFPFERQQPGVIDIGCYAAASVAHYSSSLFFVGSDQRVYRLEGYVPRAVSTPEVERQIKLSAEDPTQMRASVYTDHGKVFYSLSINLANGGQAVYDIIEGLWHFRNNQTDGPAAHVDVVEFRATGGDSTNYAAMHVASGTMPVGVYVLSISLFSDAGTVPDRELQTNWFEVGGRRVFEHEVELSMTRAANGTVEFVADDQDGTSFTHSTIATNTARVAFQRCGSFRRRRHYFAINAATSIVVDAARARISVGT